MPEPDAPEAATEPPRLQRGGTETLVVHEIVDGEVEVSPVPTRADLLKQAMREHERLTQVSADANRAAEEAKRAMFAAGDAVKKLARELLEEHMGSQYDARLVLYHLTGHQNHK